MSDGVSLVTGAAGRYATALFDLADEAGGLDAVESDLAQVAAALDDSADLRALIESPLYGREEQGRAIAAVCDKMGLGALTRNVIGLMAQKRRLMALPRMITDFNTLMADKRGEIAAEVASAHPLSDKQVDALKAEIKKAVGQDVTLNVTVDETLLGGLVVKVGSRMIDTSIRSRLAAMETAMKEVG